MRPWSERRVDRASETIAAAAAEASGRHGVPIELSPSILAAEFRQTMLAKRARDVAGLANVRPESVHVERRAVDGMAHAWIGDRRHPRYHATWSTELGALTMLAAAVREGRSPVMHRAHVASERGGEHTCPTCGRSG